MNDDNAPSAAAMLAVQSLLISVLTKRLSPLDKAENPMQEIYEKCSAELRSADFTKSTSYNSEADFITDCLNILIKILRNEAVTVSFRNPIVKPEIK